MWFHVLLPHRETAEVNRTTVRSCLWREFGLRAVALCSLSVGHDPSQSRMHRREFEVLHFAVEA